MWDKVPVERWDRPMFDEYKHIINLLEKLDTKLEQPDCEDPAKSAWMLEVEKRLQDLEANGIHKE